MRRWLAPALALALALATAAGAAEVPRLELAEGRKWVLAELPPILADDEVREHLTTGLTTSFVFRLTVRDRAGARVSGGARVEIRYELWDEVFHAAYQGIDGRGGRRTAGSLEELAEWWRGLRLVVLEGRPADFPGARALRVMVDVVPFSQAERDDTERWFSDSLDKAGRSSAEEVAQSADERPDRLSRVFNLLMATSIQRRSLTSYRWAVPRPVDGEGRRR